MQKKRQKKRYKNYRRKTTIKGQKINNKGEYKKVVKETAKNEQRLKTEKKTKIPKNRKMKWLNIGGKKGDKR